MNDTEDKLKKALERLETSAHKIVSTRGYGKDARGLKLLEEMIREQLGNATTRNSTRTIR